MNTNHLELIKKTLELAQLGEGKVSPNPMVGALIYSEKEKRILASGYHRFFGGPHAEVEAINSCPENLLGEATLYCSLEPCSHLHKKTPPCTQLIIQKKIKKVVFATLDPNPLVNGEGVRQLEEAGIEVEYGFLEKEAELLNAPFFKFMRTQIPFVHLKVAQTLDGKIATTTGDSKWITSPSMRAQSHLLRGTNDAIMIGLNTLVKDNPSLNIRYGYEKDLRHPIRIIVGGLDKMPLTSSLFNDELKDQTLVACGENPDPVLKQKFLDKGQQIVEVKKVGGQLDLKDLLLQLGKRQITSILVEGGQKLLTAFINQKLADKLTFFLAPKILGKGLDSIGDLGILEIKNTLMLENVTYLPQGDHCIVQGYPSYR